MFLQYLQQSRGVDQHSNGGTAWRISLGIWEASHAHNCVHHSQIQAMTQPTTPVPGSLVAC